MLGTNGGTKVEDGRFAVRANYWFTTLFAAVDVLFALHSSVTET
jgi:hypothetical protein